MYFKIKTGGSPKRSSPIIICLAAAAGGNSSARPAQLAIGLHSQNQIVYLSMATKNKQFSRKLHKLNTTKKTRISHFEPLESRQMMSTTLPAAPPAGSSKLTGTLIGTSGSYQNKGNTIANAIDGNTNTYFDAPSGVVGWLGFDLGAPETITQVQYVPRSGYASRMVGGVFQGSDTADFSADITTLFTVTNSPASTYTPQKITAAGSFRYVRYLAPATASGNIAELEFDGYAPGITVTPPPPLPAAAACIAGGNKCFGQRRASVLAGTRW